ncbi:MAG: PQQ-binding-like beta-propeller repeat protein, partial [Phycisphaerales bacterium]|nr:PQQ-binding-like beta-propeller repeat protein [Phycisphaerales bacterium]
MTDIANLVFVAAKRWVSAVDGRTGNVLWTTPVPGSSWFNSGFMTLAVDPTGVYASRTGRVSCLDPINGRILWTLKAPGAGQSLPIVATMLGGGGDGGNSAIIAATQAQQAAAAAAAA